MSNSKKVILSTIILLLLALVYLLQATNFYSIFFGSNSSSHWPFVFNKVVRFLLNDNLMIALIYVIFKDIKKVRLAFAIELVGLLFILPIYFVIKLSLEGDTEISSPLLSFIHRLVVNPTLMILLFVGFIYQNKILRTKNN